MNKILYKSCLNIIKINPKYRFSDLSVTNGELNKINDSIYSILIDTSYQTKMIFKKRNNIQEFRFVVVNMPEPELLFFTSADLNNITLKEFRELRAISATLKDFTVACRFEILNLEIIRIRDGEETKFEFIKPKTRDFDKVKYQAQKNDIYIFKNIKIEIKETKRIIKGREITMYIK